MSEPFNKLTPAEAERLALLSEEMGEAQQAIGKILRHGYESKHPDGGPTNRESLTCEVGDVLYAISLMTSRADISEEAIKWRRNAKGGAVWQYLHHQSETDLQRTRRLVNVLDESVTKTMRENQNDPGRLRDGM